MFTTRTPSQSRARMITHHLQSRGITCPRVLEAMGRVERERFVAPGQRNEAYTDRALPIACGQTISQPYMVALMTELLELTGTERVLEIGTGSGYQTAVLAEIAAEVITIERHPTLSQQAQATLQTMEYDSIQFRIGDGSVGWETGAPYDRILVAAAASKVPPSLTQQLGSDGILVIPVGPESSQELQQIRNIPDNEQIARNVVSCRFVPLVGDEPVQA